MRLVVIEDCDERTEATEAGEIDRDGVEISELEEVVLLAYDAMACASDRRGEGKGREGRDDLRTDRRGERKKIFELVRFGNRVWMWMSGRWSNGPEEEGGGGRGGGRGGGMTGSRQVRFNIRINTTGTRQPTSAQRRLQQRYSTVGYLSLLVGVREVTCFFGIRTVACVVGTVLSVPWVEWETSKMRRTRRKRTGRINELRKGGSNSGIWTQAI